MRKTDLVLGSNESSSTCYTLGRFDALKSIDQFYTIQQNYLESFYLMNPYNQTLYIQKSLITINNDEKFNLIIKNDLLTHWFQCIFNHLKPYKIHALTEINLSFLSVDQIQHVNFNYAKKNKPTNVLSFIYQDEINLEEISGEILLCPEIIEQELSSWPNQTLLSHYFHLLVHAHLHLLNFDHDNEKNTQIMQSIERDIIQKINYPDPYAKN